MKTVIMWTSPPDKSSSMLLVLRIFILQTDNSCVRFVVRLCYHGLHYCFHFIDYFHLSLFTCNSILTVAVAFKNCTLSSTTYLACNRFLSFQFSRNCKSFLIRMFRCNVYIFCAIICAVLLLRFVWCISFSKVHKHTIHIVWTTALYDKDVE